jgi:ribosomal peptide maturation radical SAM protein 1
LPVRDLDALPTPDYDAYFQQARRLGLLKPGQRPAGLLFESSRGCWWGQKHHCTFCGLNSAGMGFRVKSPARVFSELGELAGKYGANTFEATDNILDLKYIQDVFAAVRQAKVDYQFFYEVKANLTREQLRTLYQGGVRRIQPGLESLSSHVLQLMRKGCTMLHNVRLLKWCRYYQIDVTWNLIWGFPGETEEDYRRELDVLRRISHLQPPGFCTRIWLERFAPYFFDRERFPVRDLRPEPSYRHVYPPHVDLDKVAYFFDYTMEQTVGDEVHQPTREWVAEWQRRWRSKQPDSLRYWRLPTALIIEDHRGPEKAERHTCRGPWASVYEFCGETMRSVPQVLAHLQEVPGGEWLMPELVEAGLDDFCHKGLMVSEDGQYLSLALPVNPNY